MFESGTLDVGDVLRSRSSAIVGSLKWSSQMTSLATSRCACAASSAPATVGVLRGRRLPERVGQPARPLDAELERLDQLRVLDAQRAGRVELPAPGRDRLLLLARAR